MIGLNSQLPPLPISKRQTFRNHNIPNSVRARILCARMRAMYDEKSNDIPICLPAIDNNLNHYHSPRKIRPSPYQIKQRLNNLTGIIDTTTFVEELKHFRNIKPQKQDNEGKMS